MEVLRGDSVELRSEHDIVMARQAVRGLCQELKFSLVDLTKMVTAASELARNTLLHGKGGRMRWELVRKDERNGVKLMFEDEGPGIPDLDLAMTDGWTSGKGLGKGLPGSRRLVNEFELESTPGQGHPRLHHALEIGMQNAQQRIVIAEPGDSAEARRCAVRLATLGGAGETAAGNAALVATELATNILKHAKHGEVLLRLVGGTDCAAVEVLAIDGGPGMESVERCLVDGYSTAGTPGNGLGAVRRLSSAFDVYSEPARGTVALARIACGKAQAPQSANAVEIGVVCLPVPPETECGDAWQLARADGQVAAMLVDGLGHGVLAAEAAAQAVGAFAEKPFEMPSDVLGRIHRRMSSTRGGAVAVARRDAQGGELQYAAIGNIAGALVHNGESRGLFTHNGIVGGPTRPIKQLAYPCPAGSLLIMHSDGIKTRWQLSGYPGLAHHRAGPGVSHMSEPVPDAIETLEQARTALAERDALVESLTLELAETNQGVVALYADLEDQALQLIEASELKSRFLSYMSHEFRTPLSAMRSITRFLLERLDGPLTEEQARQVLLVQTAAVELNDMVDDLLDLAKVEAGRVSIAPEWFELVNLFGALHGMFRPLLHSDAVKLVFGAPEDVPKLYTDDRKLAQILRNFVSNALKFTTDGEVRVDAHRLEGERVKFTVTDTGTGIAAEQQEALFKDFSQLDSPLQKRLRGTGLGLSLSKKLAELLGGSVGVDSELGKGSAFWVTIPIEYRSPEQGQEGK